MGLQKIEALIPRGSIYTTIMELGPQNHNGDGLLGRGAPSDVKRDLILSKRPRNNKSEPELLLIKPALNNCGIPKTTHTLKNKIEHAEGLRYGLSCGIEKLNANTRNANRRPPKCNRRPASKTPSRTRR